MARIGLGFNMSDIDVRCLIDGNCNEAILFDGCWEYSVAFVIDVLSNNVDPSWGPCDKDWRRSIGLLKFLYEFMISWSIISGVELIEVLIVNFKEHLPCD